MDDSTEPLETTPPAEEGWVRVRKALVGLVLLWLAALAGFISLQAVAYGVTAGSIYLLGGPLAAVVSVVAAMASLRVLGIR